MYLRALQLDPSAFALLHTVMPNTAGAFPWLEMILSGTELSSAVPQNPSSPSTPLKLLVMLTARTTQGKNQTFLSVGGRQHVFVSQSTWLSLTQALLHKSRAGPGQKPQQLFENLPLM